MRDDCAVIRQDACDCVDELSDKCGGEIFKPAASRKMMLQPVMIQPSTFSTTAQILYYK